MKPESSDKLTSMSELHSDSSPLRQAGFLHLRQQKRTRSFLELSNMLPNLRINVESGISQTIVQSASSLSKQFSALVSTSTGREKVLAIFQYWGEFQCILAKNSNIPGIPELQAKKMLSGVRFMFNMKENLSQARKTFRLLKFLDDFKAVQLVIQTKKPFLYKLLGILSHYCSFMYYVSDNILFSINLLVQSKILQKEREQKWKDHKNSFSLMRVLLSIVRHLWSLFMHHKKEREVYQNIAQELEEVIKKDDKVFLLCQKLIKQRRKRRLEWLEVVIDVSRFFMLFQSLKLPGYKIVDPVYIGFCGLLSSTLSLFKMIIDKKIFASVETKKDYSLVTTSILRETIREAEKREGLVDLDGILGNQLRKRSFY